MRKGFSTPRRDWRLITDHKLRQLDPNRTKNCTQLNALLLHSEVYLGRYCGAIAVPSVTRCRCCRGHRCAGGVRQWRRATVATPGEWQCKTGGVWRLAVANGPNIFQMLLVEYV